MRLVPNDCFHRHSKGAVSTFHFSCYEPGPPKRRYYTCHTETHTSGWKPVLRQGLRKMNCLPCSRFAFTQICCLSQLAFGNAAPFSSTWCYERNPLNEGSDHCKASAVRTQNKGTSINIPCQFGTPRSASQATCTLSQFTHISS
jgi:hypothetical protein